MTARSTARGPRQWATPFAASHPARATAGQARQPPSLRFSATRDAEITADVARHVAAIDAASAALEFNDEPARFTALLQAAAAGGTTRR